MAHVGREIDDLAKGAACLVQDGSDSATLFLNIAEGVDGSDKEKVTMDLTLTCQSAKRRTRQTRSRESASNRHNFS